MGQHSELQRHLAKESVPDLATTAVVSANCHHSAHDADCGGRVVETGNCQHGSNHFDSLFLLPDQMGLSALQKELGSWQLLSAKFIL